MEFAGILFLLTLFLFFFQLVSILKKIKTLCNLLEEINKIYHIQFTEIVDIKIDSKEFKFPKYLNNIILFSGVFIFSILALLCGAFVATLILMLKF